METKDEKFSFFAKGVTCTKPAKEVTVDDVCNLVRGDELKEITRKIREGRADKKKVLPSVTFSGTFEKRCEAGLKAYSTLIVFDIDNLSFASTLKWRLSIDVFLKVVLAFISPGGEGLKFVVRVLNGKAEQHELYYKAIVLYMKSVFGIPIDESGKDIPRLCFLCLDSAVYYNPEGYVDAEALLRLLPAPVETRLIASLPPDNNNPAPVQTRQCLVSTAKKSTEPDPVADRLNSLPEVLQHAFTALYNAGWRRIRNTDYWDRPGGTPGRISAVFNRYEAENRYVFTNWSDNGTPFKTKGYSPLGVICELEFNGDFEACINELKSKYPE